MMNGQISIFDWMPSPDINDIPEAEAVQIVGYRIGIRFEHDRKSGYYRAKVGKIKIMLQYDHFVPGVNGGRLYLGTAYEYGTSGGGSPCDGIDGAVEWIRRKIEECRKRKYEDLKEVDDL